LPARFSRKGDDEECDAVVVEEDLWGWVEELHVVLLAWLLLSSDCQQWSSLLWTEDSSEEIEQPPDDLPDDGFVVGASFPIAWCEKFSFVMVWACVSSLLLLLLLFADADGINCYSTIDSDAFFCALWV